MQRLRAEHVVTPTGVLHDALLEIESGWLTAVQPYAPPAEPGPAPERLAGWAVPGFVDTHVHGGGGGDYAAEDPAAVRRARAFHRSHGTTTSFASLVTAPIEQLVGQLALLGELVRAGQLAGVHLEGPFLSPRQAGAHNPALLRPPDPATVERLLSAATPGMLAMVTLAPELPGALAAIKQFVDAGVRVAVGHTDADHATVSAAVDAGATVGTHLFNAMRPLHHREPGPIPALLSDTRVRVELIADGFHLHPAILRLAAAAAGPERVVLVTDAMAAAGMPDGPFILGGLDVTVRGGQARLVDDDGGPGPIAGSTLTMGEAFRVMTAALGDVAAVAAMASTNAARLFGLGDVGRLEAGARADLCIVDDTGVLQRVMAAGSWVPPAPADLGLS